MEQRGDFVAIQIEMAKVQASKKVDKDNPKAALPEGYYLELLGQLVSGMHGLGRKFTKLFSKEESGD